MCWRHKWERKEEHIQTQGGWDLYLKLLGTSAFRRRIFKGQNSFSAIFMKCRKCDKVRPETDGERLQAVTERVLRKIGEGLTLKRNMNNALYFEEELQEISERQVPSNALYAELAKHITLPRIVNELSL